MAGMAEGAAAGAGAWLEAAVAGAWLEAAVAGAWLEAAVAVEALREAAVVVVEEEAIAGGCDELPLQRGSLHKHLKLALSLNACRTHRRGHLLTLQCWMSSRHQM